MHQLNSAFDPIRTWFKVNEISIQLNSAFDPTKFPITIILIQKIILILAHGEQCRPWKATKYQSRTLFREIFVYHQFAMTEEIKYRAKVRRVPINQIRSRAVLERKKREEKTKNGER